MLLQGVRFNQQVDLSPTARVLLRTHSELSPPYSRRAAVHSDSAPA